MAEFLVQLVQAGIRLIITTHSTFLTEQINNAIAAHAHGSDATPPIPSEQIAAYKVSAADRDSGTTLERLPVDDETGIDLSAFTDTYERLYEQAHLIRGARETSTEEAGRAT